jgi:hypothetical protein
MALRLPGQGGSPSRATGIDHLDYEIAGEMASALGRAGARVQAALDRLAAAAEGDERGAVLKDASEAVYAYFVQREACGLRRHGDAIRDYAIPPEVLARLGAR